MLASHNNNTHTTVSGNLIKYYGFYNPPVGIISILNLLPLPWNAVFYIVDPLLGKELPYEEIQQEPNPYVIVSTHEGASHRWFDRLIPRLINSGVKADHIIIRSACLWDPDSPVKNIHTIVDECSDFGSRLENMSPNSASPTHHFVCLNRGHRWQRYALVKNILDRKLDFYGRLSYIDLPGDADERFQALTKQDVNWDEQRNMTDPDIVGALVNVVCETAYEPEPGNQQLVHHHRPGMTEKSYKCFALMQIPIWVAPYRAVACYRQFGFDVFDDIIDHSYDLEIDPVRRIDMVTEQIEKICQLDYTELHKLKNQLWPRFQQNLRTLENHAHNLNTELPQWQVLFAYNKND